MLAWITLFALPMANCLKVNGSVTDMVELGGLGVFTLLHSVPLESPYLPRLLASDFPFPKLKWHYHRSMTKEGARKLVKKYLKVPQAHKLLFDIAAVIHHPNLLDELSKHPQWYRPEVYLKGKMTLLDIPIIRRVKRLLLDTPFVRMALYNFIHFDLLFDNCLSKAIIIETHQQVTSPEDLFILTLESIDLAYAGFEMPILKLDEKIHSAAADLIKVAKGPDAGLYDFYAWMRLYDNSLEYLKSLFPNESSILAYWWAKLMSILFSLYKAEKIVTVIMENFFNDYFTEATYWLLPSSVIHSLLYKAYRLKIHLSVQMVTKMDDYLVSLHREHPIRPYYGSYGEIAFMAWRNFLSFHYRNDMNDPTEIHGYDDLVYYYGNFTTNVSTKIGISKNLPSPIKINDIKCTTRACFLIQALQLCQSKVEISPNAQNVSLLGSRKTMEQRAILRLLLTILANHQYDPNSFITKTIISIANSPDGNSGVAFLKQLIQDSCLLKYTGSHFITGGLAEAISPHVIILLLVSILICTFI